MFRALLELIVTILVALVARAILFERYEGLREFRRSRFSGPSRPSAR